MGFNNPEELVEGGVPKITVTLHQNPLGYDDRFFFFKFMREIEKRKKFLVIARDKKGEIRINPVKETGIATQSTANNAHLRFFIFVENKKSIYNRIGNGVFTSRYERFVLDLAHLFNFFSVLKIINFGIWRIYERSS